MFGNIIFLLLTGIVLLLLCFQLRKLRKLVIINKSEAGNYGKNIIGGIVAGIVVIILDRGITLTFKNFPFIDYKSLWTIFITGATGFIILLFEVGLILLLVIWIINIGLSGLIKRKKENL